jgi:hypothetical protein
MTWLLTTRLGRALSAAGAFVMMLVVAWVAGKREGRIAAATDALKDYQNTRKQADEADLSTGDVDNDLGVLRDFAERRGRK